MKDRKIIPESLRADLEKIGLGLLEPRYEPSLIRTGIVGLDAALGGGLDVGLTLVYGPASSGRTGLAAALVSEAQARGLDVAWVRGERVDVAYLEACGVDTLALPVLSAPTLEDLASELSRHRLVVVDSVDSFYRDVDDPMERNARLLEGLTRVNSELPSTTVVTISQVRHAARHRLRTTLRRFEDVFTSVVSVTRTPGGEREFSQKLQVERCRNTFPPFKSVTLRFVKGRGPDTLAHLRDVALYRGVLSRPAAGNVMFRGKVVGRNLEEVADTLRNPGLFDDVYAACR